MCSGNKMLTNNDALFSLAQTATVEEQQVSILTRTQLWTDHSIQFWCGSSFAVLKTFLLRRPQQIRLPFWLIDSIIPLFQLYVLLWEH